MKILHLYLQLIYFDDVDWYLDKKWYYIRSTDSFSNLELRINSKNNEIILSTFLLINYELKLIFIIFILKMLLHFKLFA